jgi:hypothetical protein
MNVGDVAMVFPFTLDQGRPALDWTKAQYRPEKRRPRLRPMAKVSKETGVFAALARRMTDERLPKALALKERVERGERLNELDLAFLEQVVQDARKIQPMIHSNPRAQEIAGRMLQLYNEITQKALENEQAAKP